MKNESRTGWREEWGVAPPYGSYRWHYGDYQTEQQGSTGSGQLGGWSTAALGGEFDDTREHDAEEGDETRVHLPADPLGPPRH